MKSVKTFAALLLLSFSLSFVSCSPSFDYVSTTKEIITQGSWAVDYFYTDADKTAEYKNYQFNFNFDGTVTYQQGTGTWQLQKDVAGNDILKITLNTQDANLQKLNKEWKVSDKNTVNMGLKAEPHGTGQMHLYKL